MNVQYALAPVRAHVQWNTKKCYTYVQYSEILYRNGDRKVLLLLFKVIFFASPIFALLVREFLVQSPFSTTLQLPPICTLQKILKVPQLLKLSTSACTNIYFLQKCYWGKKYLSWQSFFFFKCFCFLSDFLLVKINKQKQK